MKRLFPFLTIIFFLSCNRFDIHNQGKGGLSLCEVQSSGGLFPGGVSYVISYSKEYNNSGLPESITIFNSGNFESCDTTEYHFAYEGKIVHVTGQKRGYTVGDLLTDPVRPDGNPPVNLAFDATFDATGNATKVGSTTFKYKNGKLTGYNDYPITYDNKGNITEVMSAQGSVQYTYDLTKEGKEQAYVGAGDQVSSEYSLAELMNWIPVTPVNLRVGHRINWSGGYVAGELFFTNHKFNSLGQLISYDAGQDQTVTNEWNCSIVHPK